MLSFKNHEKKLLFNISYNENREKLDYLNTNVNKERLTLVVNQLKINKTFVAKILLHKIKRKQISHLYPAKNQRKTCLICAVCG
jgi:hypothetical protein